MTGNGEHDTEILNRFDAAWELGEPPEIADFLPPPDASTSHKRLLVELVMIDLERRWRSPSPHASAHGQVFSTRPTLHEYLTRYSQLGTADSLPVALIAEEYRVRKQWGGHPEHDEFLQRFPAQADELLSCLQRIDQDVENELDHEHTLTLPPSSGHTHNWSRSQASHDAQDRVRYFGEYELLNEIARGGMGVVFRARQVKLNRIVAIKMLLSGALAGSEAVLRFKAEAEAAANLEHPGIVPIYEIGEHQGQHFFSMAFIDGQSLADRIKAGPLLSRPAAQLVIKICDAIAFAHAHGVVHRDLKPANVMLDVESQPRVTDFGLAKRSQSNDELTATGAIMGTPSFMAPEQAAGRGLEVGPLSDIYSLGAILYALLTGRPPFQAATALDTIQLVLDQEPVPPRELNPMIPVDLETICLKAMRKSPSRRYPSVHELQADLQAYLDGQPISARPASLASRVGGWIRRNRIASAIVLGVASGVLATIVLMLGLPGAARSLSVVGIAFSSFAVVAVIVALLTWAIQNANEGPRTQRQLEAVLQDLEEHLVRFGDQPTIEPRDWAAAVRHIMPVFERLRDRGDVSAATYKQADEAIDRLARLEKQMAGRGPVGQPSAPIAAASGPPVKPPRLDDDSIRLRHWTKRRLVAFILALWLLGPTAIIAAVNAAKSLDQENTVRWELLIISAIGSSALLAIAFASPPVWVLKRRLRHFDPRERADAATRLARLGTRARSARSVLAECVKDSDTRVSIAAIRAILATQLPQEPAPVELESAAECNNVVVAAEAIQAIQQMDKPQEARVLKTAWGMPTGVTLHRQDNSPAKGAITARRLGLALGRGACIGATALALLGLVFSNASSEMQASTGLPTYLLLLMAAILGGVVQAVYFLFPPKVRREVKLFGLSEGKTLLFLGALLILLPVAALTASARETSADPRLPAMFAGGVVMVLHSLIPPISGGPKRRD